MLQGLTTVPLGLLSSPGALVATLGSTGNLLQAIGAAAAAVTTPANDAMAGIIGMDLNRVVPRFQNGVEIGEVDLMNVAGAVADPAALPGAVDTLRTDLLAALQEPLPAVAPVPPPLTDPAPFSILPDPQGPVQSAVVHATDVFFAAAFYAPELSLLGLTQTADAAATTLAATGDPVAALSAGGAAAQQVLVADGQIIGGAIAGTTAGGTTVGGSTAGGTAESSAAAYVSPPEVEPPVIAPPEVEPPVIAPPVIAPSMIAPSQAAPPVIAPSKAAPVHAVPAHTVTVDTSRTGSSAGTPGSAPHSAGTRPGTAHPLAAHPLAALGRALGSPTGVGGAGAMHSAAGGSSGAPNSGSHVG
ncbi:hypothetical protein [Tsukamurella soli]|uniref:hypothetical protein n=1 Tax=Tsukamurella soli TaxID=644556 RepID=UPI00362107D5